MNKHTPGPWIIDGLDISPKCDDELSICTVQRVDVGGAKGWFHGGVTAANAYLIAAAPLLLAALELAVYEASGEAGNEWHTNALAAIAKARGEA